jgi:multidrug efflux system outer membrane protein
MIGNVWHWRSLRVSIVALLLFGCAVGPDYAPPVSELPAAYFESRDWKLSDPADAVPKGAWWQVFGDPQLDALEARAADVSPQLAMAMARLDQALAIANIEKAALYPQLEAAGAGTRSRTAGDFRAPGASAVNNSYNLTLYLDYELDIWGRVRRQAEAADAAAGASAADYQTVMLSLQAEVALNYFALRTKDAEIALLEATVQLRQAALDMVQSRFDNGVANRLELAMAETELARIEAETIALRRRRGEFEHALAVLLGEMPSQFHLAAAPLDLQPPRLVPGLPAQLLERRPDVAAAERRVAAANARIGVAKGAFFPTISLGGNVGAASTSLGDLGQWDNRVWGLGPSLYLPIFQGGRLSAELKRQSAVYDETLASYRQTVLNAVREVEDSLLAVSVLAQQAEALKRADDAAQLAASLSDRRYRAGAVSYQEVIDTQRTELVTRRAAVLTYGDQLQASIQLVKALGGGWDEPEPVAANQ